jgi:4-amino-4-deoxy-L-arabinose transferase-like glycosyltransferase
VAILVAGAALRLWLLGRDVPTLNSDEAVIGLMGLHMLHGEWSVFYWGQDYMGSLEAVVAAPFLLVFGASALALRLATLALTLAFIATSYLLGARLYSRGVGLVAAALLAIGPPFLVIVGLRTWGGYIETLVCGNLLLLLALRGAAPATRTLRSSALFGLLAAVALYTDLLVLPFLLAAGLIFFWQRRADLLSRRALLALGGGALVVATPVAIANVFTGGGTVVQILRLTLLSPGKTPTIQLLPGNLRLLLLASLPILAGTSYGGGQGAGYTPEDFAVASAAHPVTYAMCLLLAGLALVLLGSALASAMRYWRALCVPVASAGGQIPEALVRRQGEAALALVGLCYLVAFCFTNQANTFVMPRYLLPLYALMPLFVVRGQRALTRLADRWPEPARWRAVQLIGAAVAVAALLAWNLLADAAVTPLDTASMDHTSWIAGRDEELVTLLRAHGVHTVISTDYWEGLKLTFESGESVIAVIITPDGSRGFNRYEPYVVRGLADPRTAYVELTGTPEARQHLARLAARQLPGYSVATVGLFTVLLPS